MRGRRYKRSQRVGASRVWLGSLMPMDYDMFLSTLSYGAIADLSATTVALCVSAIESLSYRNQWRDGIEKLDDAQWGYIDSNSNFITYYKLV